MDFLRKNGQMLSKVVFLEWTRFLEKLNKGLPMLTSKIEKDESRRGSLVKYRKILREHFQQTDCFYCDKVLVPQKIMSIISYLGHTFSKTKFGT
jgi:hypothetical protein